MQGSRMSGIEEMACCTMIIDNSSFNDITRKSMPIPYQQALVREDELVKCYDAPITSRNSLFS